MQRIMMPSQPGKATLVDTDLNSARQFDQGMLSGYGDKARFTPTDAKLTMGQALSCCNGMKPTDFFAHFTGTQCVRLEYFTMNEFMGIISSHAGTDTLAIRFLNENYISSVCACVCDVVGL
jgi:hypothetical protein